MRVVRLCAAAVLMAGVAVAAQPPGGGRGGMQRGGGGNTGPANLVSSKTVLADLKATDEQTGKLKIWASEWGTKQRETMKDRFQDLQGLEPAERAKKMGEWQAEASTKAYKELGEVLKPEQVTRLQQIEVQAAGARAFQMPAVQTALKLTDEQTDKLKDAADALRKEVGELQQEMGLGGGAGGGKVARPDPAKQAEFQKKSAGMTKEFMGKVDGMLTADQKMSWKGLTGEAIDVAKVTAEAQAAMMAQFQRKKDD